MNRLFSRQGTQVRVVVNPDLPELPEALAKMAGVSDWYKKLHQALLDKLQSLAREIENARSK